MLNGITHAAATECGMVSTGYLTVDGSDKTLAKVLPEVGVPVRRRDHRPEHLARALLPCRSGEHGLLVLAGHRAGGLERRQAGRVRGRVPVS